jgi:polar amino acid transport system substrate-binding protein
MKIYLQPLATAVVLAAAALTPAISSADTRVCTFPGSPSTALDRTIAREVFNVAGLTVSFGSQGIGDGDDDGISLKELDKAFKKRCDVIAGFPRSPVADGSGSKLLFSSGYLKSGYVSVSLRDAGARSAVPNVTAATYASPAQLIAVQQRDVDLDLEKSPELTVDAVASGRARRAIVWYPAVVAYQNKHVAQRFDIVPTTSPYADWALVFAFDSNGAALKKRIDAALAKMSADGRLAALTRAWILPDGAKVAQAKTAPPAFLDGPARVANSGQAGGFIKVDVSAPISAPISAPVNAPADAPEFNKTQVAHGKTLYSSSCAKCHGPGLDGVTAPALRGPAFAPAANSHLTIGGIFGYMATNMPADRPGKMRDQDYADLMAFLLYSNGYGAGANKLTADAARSSATPLNAGKSH